jgi:hypothetical protein
LTAIVERPVPPPGESGAVEAWPRVLLRLEGGGVLIAATLAYFVVVGGDWRWFALLFFAPDLSFLGYLAGPAVGAVAYNVVHTYALPLALGIVGHALGADVAVQGALIWAAQIGFDRLLGYGLKYPTAFADTHLGRIGRARSP